MLIFCRKNGPPPLCSVCYNGYNNIVKFLIRKDADVSLCASTGSRLLGIALQTGYECAAQL